MLVFSCGVFTTDTSRIKENNWKWESEEVPISDLKDGEDITITSVAGTLVIVRNKTTINADSGWTNEPGIIEGAIELIVPLGTSPSRRRRIEKALKGNPFNAI